MNGSSKAKATKRMRRGMAVMVTVLVALPVSSFAFDWNAETGFFQWLLGRQGYFTPESGHTLATGCAFEEAGKRASSDPALAAAFEKAYGAKAPSSLNQVQFSTPYQLATFGNWGNEIFTNTALEGRATHEDAGEFLKGRYHKWISSDVARGVYLKTQKTAGYSGTYYLHSEAIDGLTQDQSFDAVQAHMRVVLKASIENLQKADKAGQPLPDFTGGFKGLQPSTCNERCRGIAFLGSIFHQIEDSSASCTGGVPGALAAKGLPGCVKGDGHSVVDFTPEGIPQVVTLGDDKSYQERQDIHGHIDGLYTSCNTDVFTHKNAKGESFDFNPKLVNAAILAEVAKAVANGENPDAATERIMKDVIGPRFASPANRLPVPPTGPTTVTANGKRIAEFGQWLGERSWQPVTNYTWKWLGRFVAWVDHKWGDADGWNEGVATAWGTTPGVAVARNANTNPPAGSNPGGAPSIGAVGTER